jgi:protocatechuate 3,4-dioxygenase beta subunit
MSFIRTSYIATLVRDREEEFDPHDWLPPLDRRAALRLIGMTALATATGCNSGGSTSTSTGTIATTTTLATSAGSTSTGTAVTLTATVSPTAAAGTVTFYNGSTSLGSATLSSGSASLSASFSTAGTESLTAVYAGDSSYAASTSAAVTVTVTGTSSCSSETLEGEEGPYFVDDSASGYDRSNIVSNLDGTDTQTGVPFTLTVYVYDTENSCAAMQNVQVDIWHCNPAGIYSAESSESTTADSWLRGYQLTDANGMVKFTTILPGWYSGRTTHVHLRLRSTYDSSDDGGTNTMQLFFDQTLIDTLDTTISPYSSEGTNPTTNATDRVYSQQEDGTTLMTLSGSFADGYTATANVYLPIEATSGG